MTSSDQIRLVELMRVVSPPIEYLQVLQGEVIEDANLDTESDVHRRQRCARGHEVLVHGTLRSDVRAHALRRTAENARC